MALSFNGSSDRVDYANSVDWSTQAVTISFWVNPDNFTNSWYYETTHNSSDTSALVVMWNSSSSAGTLQWTVNGGTALTRKSSTTLTAATWQHVLMTWDGSTTAANCHFYLDGTEVSYATTTNGVSPSAATGSISIAGRIPDNTRNMPGKIAEYARWTRVLSAGEIAILAGGYAPPFIPNGLVLYSPFIRVANNILGSYSATTTGTSAYDHPRIIWQGRS